MIFLLHLFVCLFWMCLCVCELNMCQGAAWRSGVNVEFSHSFHPDNQAWWQVPLPTKPAHLPSKIPFIWIFQRYNIEMVLNKLYWRKITYSEICLLIRVWALDPQHIHKNTRHGGTHPRSQCCGNGDRASLANQHNLTTQAPVRNPVS